MVDADSTVLEVLDENPIECTDEDIAQWEVLEWTTTWTALMDYYSLSADTYVGLFWQDLTDFFPDCATADDCSDDYETNYSSGSGFGVTMNLSGSTDYASWASNSYYYNTNYESNQYLWFCA